MPPPLCTYHNIYTKYDTVGFVGGEFLTCFVKQLLTYCSGLWANGSGPLKVTALDRLWTLLMHCYVIVDVHDRRCSLSCFHSYFVFLSFALCVAIITTLLELLLIKKVY